MVRDRAEVLDPWLAPRDDSLYVGPGQTYFTASAFAPVTVTVRTSPGAPIADAGRPLICQRTAPASPTLTRMNSPARSSLRSPGCSNRYTTRRPSATALTQAGAVASSTTVSRAV